MPCLRAVMKVRQRLVPGNDDCVDLPVIIEVSGGEPATYAKRLERGAGSRRDIGQEVASHLPGCGRNDDCDPTASFITEAILTGSVQLFPKKNSTPPRLVLDIS